MKKYKSIEIERKFLMKEIPKVQWDDIIDIIQYYLNDDVRLRFSTHLNQSKDIEYIKKTKVGKGESIEVILDYDPDKAIDLINKSISFLLKTRYVYHKNNFTFEVDVFKNGLIVMEVELDNINDVIVFPSEIESKIIREVTDDSNYSSKRISTNI